MHLVIISGQSGAGKSVALDALEDIGFYGVDNLPLRLLPALADEMGAGRERRIERVAAVIDVRSPRHELEGFDAVMGRIETMGVDASVLYLGADRDVLLERFSETRRRHPLTEGDTSLSEALEREERLLEPLRRSAEMHIDTSRTNLHQLRALVQQRIGRDPALGLSLLLQSFGFKRGAPRDADMVFDVRCLPNPHWEPELRALSGRDAEVVRFLESSALVREMVDGLGAFLAPWIPRFEQGNRAYLSIAVGCTGGRHRSVYVVEQLARRLQPDYPGLLVRHRELGD